MAKIKVCTVSELADYINNLNGEKREEFNKRIVDGCKRAAEKEGQPNNPFLNGSIFNF